MRAEEESLGTRLRFLCVRGTTISRIYHMTRSLVSPSGYEREREQRGWLVLTCVRAMHARERRNVSDNASIALLRGHVVDIYGRDVEVFNRDSKLCCHCHRKLAATAKRKEDLAAIMRELTRQIERAGQRAGVQRQVHG